MISVYPTGTCAKTEFFQLAGMRNRIIWPGGKTSEYSANIFGRGGFPQLQFGSNSVELYGRSNEYCEHDIHPSSTRSVHYYQLGSKIGKPDALTHRDNEEKAGLEYHLFDVGQLNEIYLANYANEYVDDELIVINVKQITVLSATK